MPKQLPRAHHPADVADPVHRLAGVDVEAVHHVLRGLDREAAVRVHRALGPAGRARRVDDHQRVVGAGPLGVAQSSGWPVDEVGPAAVARVPSDVDPEPRHDDHVLGRTATAASAASAVGFISTGWPRRQKPSAVTDATAPASCSRVATASAP